MSTAIGTAPPLVAFIRMPRRLGARFHPRSLVTELPPARRLNQARAAQKGDFSVAYRSGWTSWCAGLSLFSASAQDGDRERWLGYWRTCAQAELAIRAYEELAPRAPLRPRSAPRIGGCSA